MLIMLLTIFVLAVFVGFEIITKVPPTLHTPLMSGSNAISGITLVGAILAAGHGHHAPGQVSHFAHRAVVGSAILGGRRALGKDTGDIAGAGTAAVGDGLRGLRLLINPGSPNSEVNALVHPPDDFPHLDRMFLVSSNLQEEEFGERNDQRKARRGEKK